MDKLKFKYRAYRYKYQLDVKEIEYIQRELKIGDIAVDIGAHKGGYFYWMLQAIGSTGQCFAFEPQQALFHYLENIKTKFKYNHLTLENLGISNAEKTLTFSIPKTKKGHSPGATFSPKKGETFLQNQLPVTTLDTYFFKRNIFPQLIKIDVEGHEWEVLQGATKLLMEAKPKIIMECEQRHLQNQSVFSIFDFLKQLGYQGFFYTKNEKTGIEEFELTIHQKQIGDRFWANKDYVNNFIFE